MKRRGRWQGMMAIVHFNWPFYMTAIVLLCLAMVSLLFVNPLWIRIGIGISVVGCSYFIVVSLGASHWIYDRSDLYRFKWLEQAISGRKSDRIVFCHSGFDESSELLREKFPEAEWIILDHHDDRWMSEPSIKRARRKYPPVSGTLSAPFDRWPLKNEWADSVFGILAIHELRETSERVAWFREASRCLRKNGRIIIIEHMRDTANFLAFGPGFLHFHSQAEWRRSWEGAGLSLSKSLKITPFVRALILKNDE